MDKRNDSTNRKFGYYNHQIQVPLKYIKKNFKLANNCILIDEHTNGLVFLEKAKGVLSHPNHVIKNSKKKSPPTLLPYPYNQAEEYYISPNGQKLFMVHRLDLATSGIMVASTNKTMAVKLKHLFKKNLISKTYNAIISKGEKLKLGSWVDPLVEIKSGGGIKVTRGKGPSAKTECNLVKSTNNKYRLSLLKLKPKTGRTHQIRVQAALRSMPIIGDQTYGDYKLNRKIKKETNLGRMFLHATTLNFKIEKDMYAYSCPLPKEFEQLMLLS